ncbi:MAG: hypothetical protein QG673_1102 [Pseudomonadota bacterium]|nr:hypothetical protein [Pseudomonadota bacterium]
MFGCGGVRSTPIVPSSRSALRHELGRNCPKDAKGAFHQLNNQIENIKYTYNNQPLTEELKKVMVTFIGKCILGGEARHHDMRLEIDDEEVFKKNVRYLVANEWGGIGAHKFTEGAVAALICVCYDNNVSQKYPALIKNGIGHIISGSDLTESEKNALIDGINHSVDNSYFTNNKYLKRDNRQTPGLFVESDTDVWVQNSSPEEDGTIRSVVGTDNKPTTLLPEHHRMNLQTKRLGKSESEESTRIDKVEEKPKVLSRAEPKVSEKTMVESKSKATKPVNSPVPNRSVTLIDLEIGGLQYSVNKMNYMPGNVFSVTDEEFARMIRNQAVRDQYRQQQMQLYNVATNRRHEFSSFNVKKGDNLSHKILDVSHILLANLASTFNNKLKACEGKTSIWRSNKPVFFQESLNKYFKNSMLIVSQHQLDSINKVTEKESNNNLLQVLKQHIINSSNNIHLIVVSQNPQEDTVEFHQTDDGSNHMPGNADESILTTTTTTTTTTSITPISNIPGSTTDLEIIPVVDENK